MFLVMWEVTVASVFSVDGSNQRVAYNDDELNALVKNLQARTGVTGIEVYRLTKVKRLVKEWSED